MTLARTGVTGYLKGRIPCHSRERTLPVFDLSASGMTRPGLLWISSLGALGSDGVVGANLDDLTSAGELHVGACSAGTDAGEETTAGQVQVHSDLPLHGNGQRVRPWQPLDCRPRCPPVMMGAPVRQRHRCGQPGNAGAQDQADQGSAGGRLLRRRQSTVLQQRADAGWP